MSLVLLLILSAVPALGMSAGNDGGREMDIEGGAEVPAQDGPTLASLLQDSPTHSPPGTEDISMRTANTKYYRADDGDLYAEVFLKDVHYRDASGEWQNVDHTFETVADGFENTRNALSSSFPAALSTGAGVTTTGDGSTVEWRPVSMGVRTNHGYTVVGTPSSGPGRVNGNIITYTGTYPGINDVYTAGTNKVKHDIIFEDPGAIPAGGSGDLLSFSYELTIPDGCVLSVDGDKVDRALRTGSGVDVLNADGEVVRSFPAPGISDGYDIGEIFRVDSTVPADWTLPCTYYLEPDGDGFRVSVEVPLDWLNAPHREFPLTLDPTETIQPGSVGQDSFIGDAGAVAVDHMNFGADPTFWFSTDSPQSYIPLRILMKFDVTGVTANVQDATLSIRFYEDQDTDTTAMTTSIYAITQSWVEGTGTTASAAIDSGVNWLTSDGTTSWTNGGAHQNSAAGSGTSTSPAWIDMTGTGMKSMVDAWKAGTNHGCLTKTTGGDNVRFVRSSDYSTTPADRPKLVLELGGPVATIVSIIPNPAQEGEMVTFTGSGTDSTGGTIVKYEWRSDIDGIMFSDTNTSFATRDLSEGTHDITLKVQNNGGVWSGTVNEELVIEPDSTAPSIAYVISSVGYDDDDDYPEDSDVLITVAEEDQEEGLTGKISIRDYIGDYLVDAEDLVDAGGGDYTYLWDTFNLPPGEYNADVSLIDQADNKDDKQAVDLVITLRDITPPIIDQVYSSVSADSDGYYAMDSAVRVTVIEKNRDKTCQGTITINSTDEEGNDDDIIINAAPLMNNGDGTYYFDWDTIGHPYGKYTVETQLWDIYGNRDGNGLFFTPDIEIVLEDVSAPVIETVTSAVGNDRDNEYLIGSVITITVQEDNKEQNLVGTITIETDDGSDPRVEVEPLTEKKRGSYAFTWKTGKMSPGEYEVQVTLEDASGNIDDDGVEADPDLTITLDYERDRPQVVMSTPYIGMVDVPLDSFVEISFSEDLDPRTVTKGSFGFSTTNGQSVAFSVEYDNETTQYPTVHLIPEEPLLALTEYSVTVYRDVTDLVGNELEVDFELYFTTAFGEDPFITYFLPREATLEFNASLSQKFNISYTPDTEDVYVQWFKNDTKLKGGARKYTLQTSPEDAGQTFQIKVKVIKGEGENARMAEHVWTVNVLSGEEDGGSGGSSGASGSGGDDDSSLLWVIIIIVIVVLMVVVLIVVLMMRSKAQQERARREAAARRMADEEAARAMAAQEANMAAERIAAEQAAEQAAMAGEGGYDPGIGAAPAPTVYDPGYGGTMAGGEPPATPPPYEPGQLGAGPETPALPPAPPEVTDAAAGGDAGPELSSWGDAGGGAAAGAAAGGAAAGAAGAPGGEDEKKDEAGETVECFECGGDVPVSSAKRPLLISCPKCGTKGLLED